MLVHTDGIHQICAAYSQASRWRATCLTPDENIHIMADMFRSTDEPKPLIWRGTSKADFKAFPSAVQRDMGYALYLAQMGERHPNKAKTLKGFGGATVIEVRENHAGDAYRVVYTVRFTDAVYVLHAFQKKSKKGSETPKPDMNLILKRLKDLIDEKERR
jgi:phage-related protein